MAKTKVYVQPIVAAIMQKICNDGTALHLPVEVLRIENEDDMREVTLKYQTPQDLFLFGMLTAKEWTVVIKAAGKAAREAREVNTNQSNG